MKTIGVSGRGAIQKILLGIIFGAAVYCSGQAMAQEQPVEVGRQRMEAFLAQVSTLRANFEQTLENPDGEVQQVSRGRLLIKRPGRFRWDYTEPYPQLVLADGERLWSVDPELQQAVVKTLDESLASSPAMLLSGEGDFEDAFSIELVKRDEGLLKIYLAPKVADSDFRAVSISFEGEALRRLELVDNLDQVTRISFSEVQLNLELEDSDFSYEPPPGVDVIDQS
jgi:outer membrane lipoprotein carrier protein